MSVRAVAVATEEARAAAAAIAAVRARTLMTKAARAAAATAAATYGWDKLSPIANMNKCSIEQNKGRVEMMGIWGLVTNEIMGVSILPGGYLPGH